MRYLYEAAGGQACDHLVRAREASIIVFIVVVIIVITTIIMIIMVIILVVIILPIILLIVLSLLVQANIGGVLDDAQGQRLKVDILIAHTTIY